MATFGWIISNIGKRDMPKQLFLKIFFGFWLVALAQTAVIIAIPSLLASSESIDPKQLKHHLGIAERLANSKNLSKTIKRVQHQIRPPHRLRKKLIDKRGRLANVFVVNDENNAYDGHRFPKDVYLAIVNHEENPQQKLYKFKRWTVYGPYKFKHKEQDYQLYLRDFNHKKRTKVLSFLTENPWIMFGIVMLVSAIICGLLSWHLSRPIRSLDRSAKLLAKGDLSVRADKLALRYHDEIGQLARSFNEMAGAIETMVNGQQRLLGDISHEIRTPLTRLQLACAIHRRQFGDNTELERIEHETETIDKMLYQLLALSRSTLTNEHPFETTEFSFFMEEIIENARFEAHQADIELIDSIPPELTVSVQWDSLASAIENILRNAIRYAKKTISFNVYAKHERLFIDISDDGCGVEDSHLSNLFTPFYRVSTARERKSGGTGLGLAIAHEAVTRHQGKIGATNNKVGGLTVTISLPLIQD